MAARGTKSNGTVVTIELIVDLGGTMLQAEEAIGACQGSCRINQAAAFNVVAGGGLSHT